MDVLYTQTQSLWHTKRIIYDGKYNVDSLRRYFFTFSYTVYILELKVGDSYISPTGM